MAVDMFLKIDGIDGDSSAHKHKGEIELLSFSWGITNKTSSTGGGGGAGKPVVQDFVIVKSMGASSPQLMEKCCSGQHIPSVSLTLSSKESKQDYLKIKLEDVLISSYQTGGGGAGGSVPMDQVSFAFRSVDVQVLNSRGQYEQTSCDFLKGTTDGQISHDHEK
jgi:type VI secretion system secreted protein Hcp